MTFKNVEVIQQEEVQTKWYERFRKKIGTSAVVVTAVATASTANAAEVPDFLAPVSTALDGIGVGLGSLFLTVIGIICVIIAFTTTKGGVKKAGG